MNGFGSHARGFTFGRVWRPTVTLALHELATNAAKYGALFEQGRFVALTWQIDVQANDRFELCWEEHGGPTVAQPTRRGFGSRISIVPCRRSSEAAQRWITGPTGLRYCLQRPIFRDCRRQHATGLNAPTDDGHPVSPPLGNPSRADDIAEPFKDTPEETSTVLSIQVRSSMPRHETVYVPQNGDDWLIERDLEGQAAAVIHQANPSSGGTRTRLPVDEFLERSGDGPEVVAFGPRWGRTRDSHVVERSTARELPFASLDRGRGFRHALHRSRTPPPDPPDPSRRADVFWPRAAAAGPQRQDAVSNRFPSLNDALNFVRVQTAESKTSPVVYDRYGQSKPGKAPN